MWKRYKVFCLKELSEAINRRQLCRGQYLLAIIWGAIIRGTAIRWAIILAGATFQGQLSWGAIIRGGNYPGGNYLVIQGEIIRRKLSGGVIIREAIVQEPQKPHNFRLKCCSSFDLNFDSIKTIFFYLNALPKSWVF